ncbi:MAG TPA: glycosyltransferase family 2 protein [Candidatus Dormibacteraeota bacterium]|nr:glycosyltransferase family 2 protein [Candidatus Dormibacteraeota bacterium]
MVASVAYLLLLVIASPFHRARPAGTLTPISRLLVLIPAHNEEASIGVCVRSLLGQTYPSSLRRVVVIADNCADATAAVALEAGATIMVRHDPASPGKGRALRWAMDHAVTLPWEPDAVVVVDADSTADPELLVRLERELTAGHAVVQAECVVQADAASSRQQLERVAVALRLDLRFAGRAALGMPALLSGNGMLFSRNILEQFPWSAFSAVEDAEYALRLRLSGVKTRYARGARVYAPATSSERGATTQGVRWEGGRFALIRTWLRPMADRVLRRRDWSLLDMLVDLAAPPLGMLGAAALAGTGVVAVLVVVGVVAPWALLPWAAATAGIAVYVLIGMALSGAPASAYVALLSTPRFVARKLRIYRRLLGGFDPNLWVRTERPHEHQAREVRRKA